MNIEQNEATVQQLFLQVIMATQVINEKRLESILYSLNHRRPESEQRSLESLLIGTNETLDAIDMELVKARNDFDQGNLYYFLINKTPLPPGLDRRFLSTAQAAQFKDMLDIMFMDSQCEGINPATDLPQDRFPSKGDIIEKLVSHQWLQELPHADNSTSNRIFISVRCLYELNPYLVDRYGGKTLHRCIGCEQWFLAGRLCSNFDCSARLHERCYEAYFRSRGESAGTCTKCGSAL